MAEGEPTSHDDNIPATAQPFVCPECRTVVEVMLGDEPAGVACPACGRDFMVPARSGATTEDAERSRLQDELSALRIKQVTRQRRAIVRARAYFVVAAIACATAVMQLLWYAIRGTRDTGWQWRYMAPIVLAGGAAWCGKLCAGKIVQYSAELKQKLLEEPATPPDFSTLSDGSQHARDLENLR